MNQLVHSEFVAQNNRALVKLTEQHQVVLSKFPDSVLTGLGELAGEVLGQIAARDSLSTEVFNSLTAFRKDAIGWSDVSQRAYLAARALPFKFIK